MYYLGRPFDVDRYTQDIKWAKVSIKNLNKIVKHLIEEHMFDNYKPQKVDQSNTATLIRCKFKLFMYIKGAEYATEGDEYRIFKDLWVNKECRIFIPLSIIFENNIISPPSKSTHLLNYSKEITWTIINEKSNRWNPDRYNFFFPPNKIRDLTYNRLKSK